MGYMKHGHSNSLQYNLDPRPLFPELKKKTSPSRQKSFVSVSLVVPGPDVEARAGAFFFSVILVFGSFFLSRTEFPAMVARSLNTVGDEARYRVMDVANVAGALNKERVSRAVAGTAATASGHLALGTAALLHSLNEFSMNTGNVLRETALTSRLLVDSLLSAFTEKVSAVQ